MGWTKNVRDSCSCRPPGEADHDALADSLVGVGAAASSSAAAMWGRRGGHLCASITKTHAYLDGHLAGDQEVGGGGVTRRRGDNIGQNSVQIGTVGPRPLQCCQTLDRHRPSFGKHCANTGPVFQTLGRNRSSVGKLGIGTGPVLPNLGPTPVQCRQTLRRVSPNIGPKRSSVGNTRPQWDEIGPGLPSIGPTPARFWQRRAEVDPFLPEVLGRHRSSLDRHRPSVGPTLGRHRPSVFKIGTTVAPVTANSKPTSAHGRQH